MINDAKITKIILSNRRSFAVIRPGYRIDAPEFIVECFRAVVTAPPPPPPPLSFARLIRRRDVANDRFKRLKNILLFINLYKVIKMASVCCNLPRRTFFVQW